MIPAVSLQLPNGQQSPIYIENGLLSGPEPWTWLDTGPEVALITNATVAELFGEQAESQFSVPVHTIQIGDGEAFKSLETYGQVMSELIAKKLHRDTTIIALGGGVVGDLAGFVAATFLRGVRLYQIPTTLLAQVDSAVGGKTAVNHQDGKNLIGAFYQPHATLIDTATLATLSDRIFVEGLAEVIKYGVIVDRGFFEWLESNTKPVLNREPDALDFIVRRSCEIKAEVVAKDEREQGLRAILNYGHTFGHALETVSGYGTLLHGEAVAIGMVMAARLGECLGWCNQDTTTRIRGLLTAFGLPTKPPAVDLDAVHASMYLDKKVAGGKLRFILPSAIGEVKVTDKVTESALKATLAEFDSAAA